MADQLLRRINQKHELEDLAIYLDTLTHVERYSEILSLKKNDLKELFKIASKGITVDDLIPEDFESLKEVIFWGKNSLPLFSHFQKRMCRSSDGTFLLGYNHQPLKWITGPGYFVASGHTDRAGEVMIDYTKVPYEKSKNWPAIKSNETGIGYFVYGGMKDFLRRVSEDVFIGEACKKGQSIGQYFVLCREFV